jgi:hypothetical protein
MRRAILSGRTRIWSALAACLILIACDESESPVVPPPCTDRNVPVISAEGPLGHIHPLQGAICEEDRGNGVEVPLTDSDHSHSYSIRSEYVEKILDGERYELRSSLSDHRHTIVYNPRES